MKKKTVLLNLIVLSSFLTVEAQWSGSSLSGNTYRTGNVGIGISSPKTKLHVNGQSLWLSGGNGSAFTSSAGKGLRLYFSNSNNRAYIFSYDYGAGQARDLVINAPGGNVGIGTSAPNSAYRLSVNGKIRAKEIKVETGWSDFVFEEDYYLPTLKEVETFIKKYGHLPEIPSTKEVEADGIYLGEMNSKLLQKIEELTLYIIGQEKRINALEDQLNEN